MYARNRLSNLGALSARGAFWVVFQGWRATRSPLATFCRAYGAGLENYSTYECADLFRDSFISLSMTITPRSVVQRQTEIHWTVIAGCL